MEIDHAEFEHVCQLHLALDRSGRIASFMPQDRYRNVRNLPLNAYGAGPFCKFSVPRKFNVGGVYALVVGGVTKYIGECVSLANRFNAGYGNISPRNCFKGGQNTNCRINALIRAEAVQGCNVELWLHTTAAHKELER